MRKHRLFTHWMSQVIQNLEAERKAAQYQAHHNTNLCQKAFHALRQNLRHSHELSNRFAFWQQRISLSKKQACFLAWRDDFLPHAQFKSQLLESISQDRNLKLVSKSFSSLLSYTRFKAAQRVQDQGQI